MKRPTATNQPTETEGADAPPAGSNVTTMQQVARNVVRNATIATAGGRQLRVKQFVNLPMISLRTDGTEVVVRILDAIHTGSEVEESRRRGAIRRPAEVMTVQSLDGMQGMLVAAFLIKEELEEKYPNATYVGRWFWIKRTDTKQKPNGESYGLYAIAEIEAPDGQVIEADAAE